MRILRKYETCNLSPDSRFHLAIPACRGNDTSMMLGLAHLTLAWALPKVLAHEIKSYDFKRATDACALPTWTFKNISVTYSEDSATPGHGGQTTFVMTNSVTNVTETIKNEVPFNYAARINGTATDPGIYIRLSFNPGGVIIDVTTTVKCDGSSVPTKY